MKRKCKNINIRDYKTLIPYVQDVIYRHNNRYDFKRLLIRNGLSVTDYYAFRETKDKSLLDDAIVKIAQVCAKGISTRNLDLPPIRIRIKVDKANGKIRPIGKESALQQVYDYVAYHSAKEIFDKRIVYEQASSIKYRGQLYGVKIIKKWIVKDNDALRYAKRHGVRYTRKCKYQVKCDITKCFPNAKVEKFIALFEKDCANDDIVWLWKTLLESHKVEGYEGFMIGSLVSQWACQYMMSFLYRYAKGLHYERRGTTYQSITHAMLFMDDQLYLGSNRKELKIAIEKIVIYANDVLGFSIKPNWHIYSLEDKSIDMMGYTISSTGQVEIRDRNFIRARRMCIRYENQGNFLTYRQCRRICSYKGYFLNSNTDYAYKKYNFKKIVTYASQKISEQERSKNAIQEC